MRRAYRYPPDVAFYIYFLTNISTEYFKHAAQTPFFSSKCRLFHNSTFFGSCIIHILHTGVLNLNAKLRCQKVKIVHPLILTDQRVSWSITIQIIFPTRVTKQNSCHETTFLLTW